MIEYQENDKALVRSDLYDDMPIKHGFNSQMGNFCGKIVTISDILEEDLYIIKEDNGKWWWCAEMFAFKIDKVKIKSICPVCGKKHIYKDEQVADILQGKIKCLTRN